MELSLLSLHPLSARKSRAVSLVIERLDQDGAAFTAKNSSSTPCAFPWPGLGGCRRHLASFGHLTLACASQWTIYLKSRNLVRYQARNAQLREWRYRGSPG